MTNSKVAMIGLVLLSVVIPAQNRGPASKGPAAQFTVVEAGIPEIQAALKSGRVTSRELVIQYLTRIALYEHTLHAAIAINPRAIQDAEALDRERAEGKIRGPLHGIPVALKDNIQTTNMPTSGGVLAFSGYI